MGDSLANGGAQHGCTVDASSLEASSVLGEDGDSPKRIDWEHCQIYLSLKGYGQLRCHLVPQFLCQHKQEFDKPAK